MKTVLTIFKIPPFCTWGVGIPMAVQLITKVKVWSTVTSGGGDTTIRGDLQPMRGEHQVT